MCVFVLLCPLVSAFFSALCFFVLQRHNSIMERRNQPGLPVDDALLHTLPPGEERAMVSRPLLLKKLSIAAHVAGPMLRGWDFLYVTSQVIF